jgi:hypothetical protein
MMPRKSSAYSVIIRSGTRSKTSFWAASALATCRIRNQFCIRSGITRLITVSTRA